METYFASDNLIKIMLRGTRLYLYIAEHSLDNAKSAYTEFGNLHYTIYTNTKLVWTWIKTNGLGIDYVMNFN